MNKDTSRKIVRETFSDSFDRDRFIYFLKNLLNKFDEATFIYRGNTIPQAYRKHITTLERIGKYTNGESEIDLLIVKLENQKSLDRARTMQRNFIAWYLNGSRGGKKKDGALVAFVSPDTDDWRFSLVKMDYKFETTVTGKIKVKEDFTPARRWSFLVGKHENSHTAQSRLTPIVEDDEIYPSLLQLEEAFNIEKVTKEFFEKYRELFLKVKEELDAIIVKDNKVRNDFENKNINTADFSKKLLGQIVFLYFLQKKGWFGVERDNPWGTGPKNFLRQLFEKKHGDFRNFFNEILEPLFYEALASERDGDYYSRFNCKIPFLNGGLFDPIANYDWVNTDIIISNDLFSNEIKTKEGDNGTGILDIFDRYNFTVKEDEPLEREVAVDPEMLGKVFENLLEIKDRKSKGTYYTPREIVHYMCEQSLVNYLSSELGDKTSKEDLETFIKFGDTFSENDSHVEELGQETETYKLKLPSIKNNAELIDNKLADIKVCDPAIGSGAFPVGMMSEIVKARNVLSSYIKTPGRSLYEFKSECIQNSIYGVDIDPGAVEIAKLRLWLSLVVDEDDIKSIKPLPNLDYKIMQGNSLLEEFEGIKLFDDKLLNISRENNDTRIAELETEQRLLQPQLMSYYQKNPKWNNSKGLDKPLALVMLEKRNIELKNLLHYEKGFSNKTDTKQAGFSFDSAITSDQLWRELQKLHNEFLEAHDRRIKLSKQNTIEELNWSLIETSLREQGKQSLISKIYEFRKKNIKPFFLWKLHFSDVFANNGGFDIVIGNPPYVSAVEDAKADPTTREYYRKIYPDLTGAFDLYVIFLLRALEILNTNGNYSWIIPNKFLVSKYAEKTNDKLKESGSLKIVSVSKLNVFDTANVYPIILLGDRANTGYSEFEADSLENLTDSGLRKLKAMKTYKTLKDFGIKISAGATGFQATELKEYIDEVPDTNKIPFIVSGAVDPWVIDFTNIRYMGNKYKKAYIRKGSKIAQSKWDFWNAEKVIIAGMTKRIEAVFSKKPIGLGVGIYGIYDFGGFSPLLIVGLLNSDFYTKYFQEKFKDKHLAGGYLAINKSTIEDLPMTVINDSTQNQIIQNVAEIMALTPDKFEYEKNFEKIKLLEKNIDVLVDGVFSEIGE